jgi:hypothetical protein
LQNGQEEKRKKVKITLLPIIDDISKVVPSMAGNDISGAGSPIFNLGILLRHISILKSALSCSLENISLKLQCKYTMALNISLNF